MIHYAQRDVGKYLPSEVATNMLRIRVKTFDRWRIMSFIVPFIFVNIVHIHRVSISVRVRVLVRLKVSIT